MLHGLISAYIFLMDLRNTTLLTYREIGYVFFKWKLSLDSNIGTADIRKSPISLLIDWTSYIFIFSWNIIWIVLMVINIIIWAIEVAFRKFYRFHLHATQLGNELFTLSVSSLLLDRVHIIVLSELNRQVVDIIGYFSLLIAHMTRIETLQTFSWSAIIVMVLSLIAKHAINSLIYL